VKRRLPTLSSLRAFEAAARWGSFKNAAEELAVTPTSISHQVRSLEGQLGVRLFSRFNRRVELTEEGRSYAARLSSAFDEIDRATNSVRQDGAAEAGPKRLVIVGNPGFVECWLRARLVRFREKHPEVSLELIPDDATEHHLRNRADVAIHYGFAPPQAFASEHLSATSLFPVCSPDLMRGETGLRAPADLARSTLLHESGTQSWLRWLEEVGCGDTVDGQAGTVFHTSSLAMESAVAGDGVAMADGLIAGDHLLNGRLAKPFSVVSETSFGSYLVFASDTRERTDVRVFRDWLFDAMKGFAPEMERFALAKSFGAG